jgi:capsular exopolysaccharide synthesis family protein
MNAIESKPTISSMQTAIELAPIRRNDSPSMGFIDAVMLLRRQQWLIGLVVVACTLLAILATYRLPKIYVADSTVVLERKDSRPFESDIQLKSQDRDKSGTETEMDIMVSRLVAGRVVDDLKLLENPDFNPNLNQASSVANPTLAENDVNRDHAITTLLSQVSVSRRSDSLAIVIRAESYEPQLAAKIADTIADTYVNVSMDFKRQFASKALKFLNERGSNPLLTAMRTEDAQLQQTRAELAAKFGDKHPEIQAIDAKIQKVRVIIAGEFDRMSQDMDNETERPSARVLSKAQIPNEPTYPKSNMIILGALAGSTLLSIILALIVEGLGTAIRSGEQTRQLLQIPNLAYVPTVVKAPKRLKLNPVQEIVAYPQAGFAVSMRSLYLACRLPKSDRSHQVVMLASCRLNEGKSRLSIGLAATAAADGKKTILVDLDWDDHKVLSTLKMESASRPIDDFLSGECGLADTICKSLDMPGLSVIASSQQPRDQAVHLSSDRLRHLVSALRKEYDFIVIDTAPVLSVDDANWMAPLVDATILVLAWGKTKESELWDAAAGLRLYQAPLIGTIINDVDPKLQARYGLATAVH